MFYDLEDDERTAVKTAMALAVTRYNDTLGKFVQRKASRLSIVPDQVERIARECAEAARADEDEVVRLFEQYLAELAVSEPEKQKVDQASEYNNSDEVPQPERSERDDVKSPDAVLEDSPAETLDMNDESSLTESESEVKVSNQVTCPYCGHMMTTVQNPTNPAASGSQQQCPNCGATIQSTPGNMQMQPQPGGILPPGGESGGLYTTPRPFSKCARCEKEDAEENSILCEACNHFVVLGEEKTAQGDDDGGAGGGVGDPDLPTDESVQSPAESDSTEQTLPPAVKEDSNGPAEVYTGVVQQTANQNAAMAWSTPGDDDIRQITQQYGLQEDQVRKDLRIVADFGDSLAVNGDPNGDPNMDGYTELTDFGGRIPTTEEEVDVDNAIQHTADRTNLSPDDIYALVKESYGGDLGGQHYVSVSGEAHYYLPANLVPQSEAQPNPTNPQDAAQAQQPQPMQSHLISLTSFIDWEKAQLANSDA